MDQDLQNYYKLTLAHDLILFLMHVQTDGLSQEQKANRTNMILQAWENRVDLKLEKLSEENLKEISEKTDDDLDVLKILQNVHTLEPSTIRKEFKREVRHFVFKSYEVK